ncbi:uncharacterized protein LOC124440608 isoform X1 [Xenia sp. Carnegie-2017]|uniref:uncharacterized protein LOC124440608 isoform X1 n=1 Tax=Xenia sp. Carnegie-2017 TaxID=2897299 RepID=UPI001F03A78F|nr:uncharacterized protein LOC124440608 isoform X1 [Xenia sp. Carnegie-2017]
MPTSGSTKRKKRKERQRRLSQVSGSNTASNENDSSDNYGLTEAGYSLDFSQDVSNRECGAESSVENETNEYKREEQIQEVGAANNCIDSEVTDGKVREERNFARLIRLLMGVGASTLRQLFLSIHKNWSNQPSDASALKKGALKLQKHQETQFYKGNIEEWDVSLLVSVLRFSTVCSNEVSRKGVDFTLRDIQEMRNLYIAHANNEKMSDEDFKKHWEKLKLNLVAIGASEEEINKTLTDWTERSLEYYRQSFLEEIAFRTLADDCHKDIITMVEASSKSKEKDCEDLKSTPQWDDWLKLCSQMNEFNSSQTQFVLFADVMSRKDLENFKVLAAVPWKVVVDFNPSSEDDGLYNIFNSQACLMQFLSAFTPGEISSLLAKIGIQGLSKQFDIKKTQWLFANGRTDDAEDNKPKPFHIWEQNSVNSITMFFACCAFSDMFDVHKPIRCLVLPISPTTFPFIEVTLRRFKESFSRVDLSFAFIGNLTKPLTFLKQVENFQLSSTEVKNGVRSFLNVGEEPLKYEMPCFQSGVRAPFSQKDYVYINEYLELFYIDCQNEYICANGDEKESKENEEEHRRSFLSGNLISFLSLFFTHDAKRKIEMDIMVHIQRMLNQMIKQSGIVQIAHPPGTGGSTIARRVLWNLHDSFPCASVRLSTQAEFDEDSNFIGELSSRISFIEDQCGTPPVILIDGHRQWRIHALSNRVVRTLNSRGKKAIILECHRGAKPNDNADVHQVFHVDACLEETQSDLREFKDKFKEINNLDFTKLNNARRVFHFPLLSMITEFREKLEEIVADTLNELNDLEKDIAAFVAFLQLYAEQPTPATLLYEVFESQLSINKGVYVTYEDIKNCFSHNLLNLMVLQKKRQNAAAHRRNSDSERLRYVLEGQRRQEPEEALTNYTLQHHVVATILFEKYLESKKITLYKYVFEFLNCNVPNIKKYVALYCDLFLFNRGGNRKLRFSVLIAELKKNNAKQAASALRKAAEIIPDPRAYGHAARYYAKMRPPRFKEAEELVAAGIKLSETYGRVKSIQDSKGVVHSLELKYMFHQKKVKDIEHLENMADKALLAFRAARDFPPTFASPLIGEVGVWIICIQWIIGNHNGDAEEAVKFIINQAPPFFRTCIGDCFYLLEIVDKIVLSVTIIADADEIRDRANEFRISLIKAVQPGILRYRNRRRNISEHLLNLDFSPRLPPISWKESKRVRTRILLSLYYRDVPSFKNDDMKELMKLLEDMILSQKDFTFAPHFLQLCLLGHNPSKTYKLEQGWKVCCDWLDQPDVSDPMVYYYSMVIAFVQILNGHGPSGFFAKYKSLWEKLKDSSRGHCRRNQPLHFLKKHGSGMSQLISHQALLSDVPSYNAENSDVVKNFWMADSRRKLRECSGRLRVRVEGMKKSTKIELLEGDIELYVGKYAEIGTVGKDFDKDAKVFFVVSFNLRGPVANGISFHPTVDQKSNGSSSNH